LTRCRVRLDRYCQSPVFRRPADRITGTRKMHLDFLNRRLEDIIKNNINRHKGNLATIAGRLNALSPLSTLVRGYSICVSEETGEVLKNASDARPGDGVKVRLHRGTLLCHIEKTLPESDL